MPGEIAGSILTPQGFVNGTLEHRDGRVRRVEGTPVAEAYAREHSPAIVLPGFVDTHVHGGGGSDTMQGGDAIDRIARLHARHGTTSLLATPVTSPLSELKTAMAALGPACRQRSRGGGAVPGVEPEGPSITPRKHGAQPDVCRP